MSDLRGRLDPEARAAVEAVLAKWAAPGMCNSDDEVWCVDGEPSTDSVVGDARTTGQRNHDALKALARAMLASGQLGSHHGLPVTLVVSTTLKELESGRGHAVTAGGSLLPMSEVIRQAARPTTTWRCSTTTPSARCIWGAAVDSPRRHNELCCTPKSGAAPVPGCTAPAYWCQVHDVEGGLGRRQRARRTSTTSPWPAAPTTAWSKTAAGPPANL